MHYDGNYDDFQRKTTEKTVTGVEQLQSIMDG